MDNDILDLIKKTLEKHLNKDKFKFFLYWSRAKWNYHFRSDYDIGILWDEELDFIKKNDILEDFEKIPALIDLTDFSRVSDDFKKHSMKNIIYL